MKTRRTLKKLTTALLAVAMLAMILPVGASAETLPELSEYNTSFSTTNTTIGLATINSKTYDGEPITYDILIDHNSDGYPNTMYFTYNWTDSEDITEEYSHYFEFRRAHREISYTYYDSDGNKLTEAPTDAGNYKLIVTGEANYQYEDSWPWLVAHVYFNFTSSFTIYQAEREVTITQESWTYGEDAKQPVISCSTNDTEPTIEYYYGEETGWLETVPTNAGTYTVRATYPETKNYKETVATADFTINQATRTVSIKQDGWTYGEDAKQPVISCSTNDNPTLIQYNTEDGNLWSWTTKVPTDAGTYKVMAYFDATENYESIAKIAEFTIKPRQLTVTVNAEDKEFDGTTTATVNPQISGVIAGDTVNLNTSKMKATFSSATVGEDIKVTVRGLTIDNDNYKLPSNITGRADIDPKSVSVINLEVEDKSYDGTTDAEITGTPSLSGLIEGYDDVQLVNGTPSFVDSAVGSGIGVNFTEFTLTGDDVGNYTLVQPTGITANITECLHANAADDGDCTTAVVCGTCGETVTAAKTSHVWGNWESNGDGTHTGECTTDGCTKTTTENCSGGTATCRDLAVCIICKEPYGDFAAHAYGAEWITDDDNHWHACTECGETADEAGHADNDSDHLCDECGYAVSEHSGGTATCTEAAICDICKEPYGNLAAHAYGAEWITDADNHWHACTECGETADEAGHADNDSDHLCDECGYTVSEHSGGTATCTEAAICDICREPYGNLAAHAYGAEWITDDDNHWHACTECGEKADVAAHEDNDSNHLCDECGYTVSEHSGGTATCTEAAICDICKEPYGNLAAHAYGADWITDADNHWHACTECGEKADVAAHEDNDSNHLCDECGYTVSEHTGGTATCKNLAVCSICQEPYGNLSLSNHTNLVRVPAKDATTTAEGNTEYWYCSGCEKYFNDAAGKKEIKESETIIPKLPVVTEGDGQTVTVGEKKELEVTFNDEYSGINTVLVDGIEVDANSYDVSEDGTVVTLKGDYVSTLSEGEHTLSVVSENGEATAHFTVSEKSAEENTIPEDQAAVQPATASNASQKTTANASASAQTGDESHMILWISLAVLGVGAVTATAAANGKRRKNK